MAWCAWIGRYSLDADGISYLDLSDALSRHDWHGFLNAYWSPLYPLLLGLSRLFLPASKYWELPSVHILNLGIYGAALGCFEFFYSSLRRHLAAAAPLEDAEPLILGLPFWFFAHALFLWTALDLITVWGVSPDLCVSAFVYAIAGLILRLRLNPTWKASAALGIVLGLSYWAKAVMFPLAFVFVGIALVAAGNIRIAVKRGVIVAATFAALALPLVTALTLQKHRLTFGDSGRINYAMFVSPRGPTRNWQGEPALGIKAVHPTRRILADPPVYEFAEPIGGTFPPWYDPSYWQEGRNPRFSLTSQIGIAVQHLLSYADLLLHQENALFAVTLALVFVLGKNALREIRENWPLLLICVAAFGLYMLVHAETRFLGAYVAILWIALLSPLRGPKQLAPMTSALLAAIAVALLVTVLGNTARAIRENGPYSAMPEIILSDRLDVMGAHGDRIAAIGSAGFYGVRLSHAKIVAEIMGEDAPKFWRLSPEGKELVLQKFRESGARVIVAADPGPFLVPDPSWIKVKGEPFYLHPL